MGYPRKYVGHYPHLASWLRSQGHSVYPMEMICNPVHVPKKEPAFISKDGIPYYEHQNLYGAVDVVTFYGGKIWAWEYKSQGDSLKRALSQLTNYARSFDYVCLASVIMPHGELYDKLRDLGSGLYAEVNGGFMVVDEPKQQKPILSLHEDLVNRFRRNVYSKPTPKSLDQSLVKWVGAVNSA